EEAREPFDLVQGPLLRASLVPLATAESLFLLTIHHIVSDGWSMAVFFRELGVLYTASAGGQAPPLAELTIQYADFAVWQREWLRGPVLEEQLEYWKRQLARLSVLAIATDRPRPPVQTFRGAEHYVTVPSDLLEKLKGVSQAEGVTLFMTLLAAFKVLSCRY